MKLEITKDKVLEAANKCQGARKILETLFPEAFLIKHPYGSHALVKKIGSEIFFEIPHANDDWTSVVISFIREQRKKIRSTVIDGRPYLGYDINE